MLTGLLSLSVKIVTVMRGRVNVDTITSAGYSSWLAEKSTWHVLVHEMTAGLVKLVVGTKGVNVCNTVVGTSSVVVINTEEITVDTIVDAGI